MFDLVVDIFEGRKLILTHVFHGATRAEALGYYNAHLKYDQFLRECIGGGVFRGRVPCRARTYWR